MYMTNQAGFFPAGLWVLPVENIQISQKMLDPSMDENILIAELSSSWQFHWNWAKLALVSTITTHPHPPTRESTKPNLDWAWNRQIVKLS